MDVLWFAIYNDWAVLMPVVVCSVLGFAVTIERILYFRANKSVSYEFVQELQRSLDVGPEAAKQTLTRQKGIVGRVASEGIDIIQGHPDRFEAMFDISVSLAMRELEYGIALLGTIASISPYLGLFGTVIRILLTFGELAQAQTAENTSSVMFGIGSALIATAFGLGVAICAVTLNNLFRSKVERYAGDFEVLKLVFFSAIGDTAMRQQRTPGRRAVEI